MDIRTLFNDDKMKHELKNKLDCLEDTNDILERIREKLDSKMNSVINNNELVIKIDRRKNKDGIIGRVRDIISSVLKDPESLDLLLKIIENDNEIVVRKRREKVLG